MNKHCIITNCPTCKKTIEYSRRNEFRPFCSERCKVIDLGEWADETNRIHSGASTEFNEKGLPLND